jgi:hypothetical protein
LGAEYIQRAPGLVEMHLRGLTLMYRLVPGCEAGDSLWDKWALGTLALWSSIEGAILPGLVPTTALFNRAARYLPPHITIAEEDKIPFLLAMLKQCDDIFSTAERQVEREKRRLWRQSKEVRQQLMAIREIMAHAGDDLQMQHLLVEAVQQETSQLQQITEGLQRHSELMDWQLQQARQQGRSGQQGQVQQHSPLPQSAVQLRDRWLNPALAVGEAARLLLTIPEVYDNPQGKEQT